MIKALVPATLSLLALVLVVACESTSKEKVAHAEADFQYSFASPEEAALALANAAADLDSDALRRIFGPDVSMLSSGDSVQDDIDLQRFALAYDRAHAIQRDGPDTATLLVGEHNWAFPVPIVRDGERWLFDTVAGGETVREARIAFNEERAILALVALAGAETVYFDMDPDGDGARSFAARIASSPGATDGLYWSDETRGPASPVGVGLAVADASLSVPEPYEGYLFRVLPPSGERGSNTVAIAAFPATVGVSGRRTFVIVDGVVWQRQIGTATRSTVMSMRGFAPDASWTRVETK